MVKVELGKKKKKCPINTAVKSLSVQERKVQKRFLYVQ